MRKRISKGTTGRNNTGRKEVRLGVNRAGRTADGSQRYSLVIRFTEDAWKKATDTEYVAVDNDEDLKRLYFVSGNSDEGFKLTGPGKVKSISFAIQDKTEWEKAKGCYFLLKDSESGDYYIDYSK